MTEADEGARLEALWAGEFGDDYVQRNQAAGEGRGPFWQERLGNIEVASALEVGCNIGGNLRWLAEFLGPGSVAGIDVNERALTRLREAIPDADLRRAHSRSPTTPSTSSSRWVC